MARADASIAFNKAFLHCRHALRPSKRTMPVPGNPAGKAPARRQPNAVLMPPVQPDEALSAIVGSTPRPRGALTRKLWDYQREQTPGWEKEDQDQCRHCPQGRLQRQEDRDDLRDDQARFGTRQMAVAALGVMTACRCLAVSMQLNEKPLPRHRAG